MQSVLVAVIGGVVLCTLQINDMFCLFDLAFVIAAGMDGKQLIGIYDPHLGLTGFDGQVTSDRLMRHRVIVKVISGIRGFTDTDDSGVVAVVASHIKLGSRNRRTKYVISRIKAVVFG